MKSRNLTLGMIASLLAWNLTGCSDAQSGNPPSDLLPSAAGSEGNAPVVPNDDLPDLSDPPEPPDDPGTDRAPVIDAPPGIPSPPPDPGSGAPPSVASGEWLRFEDEFSPQGCDLINGADFEAIVRADGRLEIVSELAQDVSDRPLPGLYLDEDSNLFQDGESEPLGRVRFKHDGDGTRRAWLLATDGSAWTVGDEGRGSFPLGFHAVPCAACPYVDEHAEGACEAAIAAPLANGEVQPGAITAQRFDLAVRAGGFLRWEGYSGPGVSCDAINGADFVAIDSAGGLLLVSEGAANVPDRLLSELDLQRVATTTSVIGDPLDPLLVLRGSWQLVLTGEGGGVAGELLFLRDADEQLRLWLMGPDGKLLSRSTEGSSLAPSDFSDVPCRACPGPDGDIGTTACD